MKKLQRVVIFFLILTSNLSDGQTQMPFVKTLGGDVLNFEEGSLMDCAFRCQRTNGCTCIRMNSGNSEECEQLTGRSDANTLNHTGWVYYAWDRYKETFESESVALKKVASQSSEYVLKGIRYTADRAIDGKHNTDYLDAPYFAYTRDDDKADKFPWWQVDLGREHVVTGVAVLNRKDKAHRLHDFEIRIGNTPISGKYSSQQFTSGSLCAAHRGGGIASEESRSFTCLPCPIQGRYVTIQIVRNCESPECSEPTTNTLNLPEVDVYGFIPNVAA